ncbi:MAG: DNA repair protein RadA [Lachnospiraceae bacterium]|nr:DNA repair protein RadA [Lachnospiraceae bacterium]
MAGKAKTVFFCKECGQESTKWMGQCPGCKEWNTFVEEPVKKTAAPVYTAGVLSGKRTEPQRLDEVSSATEARLSSGLTELDRVLGGGIVNGSLVLVGGDPGIGKSTLLLQMCSRLAEREQILYISGEESLHQIKMRADRLEKASGNLLLLSETSLDAIEKVIEEKKPQLVVIDSIQTMFREDIAASPGSVSQVRETTSSLMRLAKGLGVTIFIVGHVTKEGVVAGPRVLEHMVDTVLYFEGDSNASYRILRAVKNRFGSTNEIGVFEMRGTGLEEIHNPSEYMLQGRPEGEAGSVVTAMLEGSRILLVEVQALVCQTNFNMPRRTAAGTDYNRVNLLMAVLEKRLGIQLSFCDAYLNVAGGMRINEPALDLAIVMALLSSYKNRPVASGTIVFGEVGLTGEVRGVSQAEQRVAEAKKLGYENCILPAANLEHMKKLQSKQEGIKLIGVRNVKELFSLLD